MQKQRIFAILLPLLSALLSACAMGSPTVQTGAEVFFSGDLKQLRGKRVGLLSQQSAHHKDGKATWQTLIERAGPYQIAAFFGPEHGFWGASRAYKEVDHEELLTESGQNIKIHSLYGKTRRPTPEMLADLDLLIVDLQDVGVRCYTYISTLFYVMEEAGKIGLPLIILDRPNPIGGEIVDGPLLELPLQSFVGCAELPFCHGMTIGELARYFNERYCLDCELSVVAMRHYKRSMTFCDTGLPWPPTSPHMPEGSTPHHYAVTNLLGEFDLINHGVGFTAPFKLVGAPWIDPQAFQKAVIDTKIEGAHHLPFHFIPFFGKYKEQLCHGLFIDIDQKALKKRTWRPFIHQMKLALVLKALHPDLFAKAVDKRIKDRFIFDKCCGTKQVLDALASDHPNAMSDLFKRVEKDVATFYKIRKPYLISSYSN